MDRFFYEGRRNANLLTSNSDISLMVDANTLSNNVRYSAVKVSESINNNIAATMDKMSWYIYLPNLGMILSNGSLLKPDEFFYAYYPNSELGYKDWFSYISGDTSRVYSIAYGHKSTDGADTVENVIPISQIGVGNSRSMSFITSISCSSLFEDALNEDNCESIIILGEDGQILADWGSENYSPEAFQDMAINDKEIMSFKHDKEHMEATCISSEWNNIKYIFATRRDAYFETAIVMERITIVSFIVLALIGAVIIYLTINRHYKPIKKIVKLIDENRGGSDSNEYELIRSVIEKLMANNSKSDSMLRLNNERLRNVYLVSLLTVGKNKAEALGRLKSIGVDFESKYFYVAIIRLSGNGCFEGSDSSEMAEYAVANIVDECVEKVAVNYTCSYSGMVMCAINIDNDDGMPEKFIKELETARKHIENYLQINVNISVSGRGESAEELGRLYYDALYAMEYGKESSESGIAVYTEVSNTADAGDDKTIMHSYVKWNEMLALMRNGDSDSAKMLLEDILSTDFSNASQVKKKAFACIMISMVASLANEMGALDEEGLYAATESIKAYSINFDVNRFRDEVTEICEKVCEYVQSHSNQSLSHNIMEYMEKNYADFDLNVSMLSREFNMPGTYLSKTFLEQTGTRLLDYINMYRVKMAKDMIDANPNIKIEEVGERAGFAVSRTFLRTFKKYQGISPSAYRGSLRMNQ